MCMRATCRKCSKVTYSGCGKHLEKVFRGLDDSELCRCRVEAVAEFASSEAVSVAVARANAA